VFEDRNGRTYSFDVCSKCKLGCCQDVNPPLSLNRRKKLAEFVREKKIPLRDLFSYREYSYPSTDKDGFCEFYDKETRKCVVHPVKPETCCAGPITFDINLERQRLEFYLKNFEVCAFAELLYRDGDSLRVHLEAAKVEILRLVNELDADNLQAVLRIPEPETFKIDEIDLSQPVKTKLGIAKK